MMASNGMLAIATVLAFFFLARCEPAVAAPCGQAEWRELGNNAHLIEECLRVEGRTVRFVSLAIYLTEYDLTVTGSGPGRRLPSEKDVVAALEREGTADEVAVSPFSLSAFLNRSSQSNADFALSVGYPAGLDDFIASGLVRSDGKDLAERDLGASFKSAIICWNETGKNDTGGSRVVVFNAFERTSPVTLNGRVADKKNCPHVTQAGPRIVEYRAKPGVRVSEKKTRAQHWLVFSQGDGDKFYGYFTLFLDPINLYDIQNYMVSGDHAFRVFDARMRVAVALTTGHFSALAVKREAGGSSGNAGFSFFGKHGQKAHPVFLTGRYTGPQN